MLSVPLDYARPSGAKIQLAVSRVVHTSPDEDYQGIMLVNPGGPGGSGLIYSVLGAFVPGDVGSTYDWIGFDPRGVGDSVPALSCDPNYTAGPRPPYDPATVRIEFAWLVKSAKYAIDCARNGGFLLGHLKTTDTVADMDAIRQSLGAEQDELLRLLVRHLPGSGVRHPPSGSGAAHGARLERRSAHGLVPSQPRPGPRLRDHHQQVLRLGRAARRRLPPRHDRCGRVGEVLRSAQLARCEPAGPARCV